MSNQKKEQLLNADANGLEVIFNGSLRGSGSGHYIYGITEKINDTVYILNFNLKTITGPGTYEFNDLDTLAIFLLMENGSFVGGGHMVNGQLIITKYDFNEPSIEGTFAGLAKTEVQPEAQIRLTNGKFKLYGITAATADDVSQIPS